jgi:type I restriction enzyme M protein
MADPNLSSFIWSVADLLRGDYKQSEYGKVILPFTVRRRLDCVLEATKPAVLAKSGLLYLVTEKFANIDRHPAVVSNPQMGAVFEELIRKFAELSNETAGEHFTPREVIRLMVNLLFIEVSNADSSA